MSVFLEDPKNKQKLLFYFGCPCFVSKLLGTQPPKYANSGGDDDVLVCMLPACYLKWQTGLPAQIYMSLMFLWVFSVLLLLAQCFANSQGAVQEQIGDNEGQIKRE